MKPGTPPLQSTRLLDQMREWIRYLHYSFKTEKVYLYWTRFFIRWSAAQPGGMRHPRDRGASEVEAFLSMMASEPEVSAWRALQLDLDINFLREPYVNWAGTECTARFVQS